VGNLTVLNVMTDYGAFGDGVADDTAAINAAFAAVPAANPPHTNGGAIVYFPSGTYLVSGPLTRQVSYTRCVGEGKDSTTIRLNPETWTGAASPAEPDLSFILDLAHYNVTDCSVEDMTIDGQAQNLESPGTSALYSGILCSARSMIERVNLYDVWGYGLWISGQNARFTRVIDCEADLGSFKGDGGSDCIGGGGYRISIVRFHWKPGMNKNSAVDMTTSGQETSVSLYDCTNESVNHIILEGATQSLIHGCRLYGNNLHVTNDAIYIAHATITR